LKNDQKNTLTSAVGASTPQLLAHVNARARRNALLVLMMRMKTWVMRPRLKLKKKKSS